VAKTIQLEMITPEKIALQALASFVVLPAREGEMGVLPGHEPYWVELTAGEVRVTSGEDSRNFAIGGGFAEIIKDRVSIFAESADLAQEIDEEREHQILEKAKAEVSRRDLDPITLAAAEAAMRLAQVKLRVSELRGRKEKRPRPEAP
jgi:F-type H+-transporting ATPase subunit epsilon